ncbi:MAG: hypothetical protein Q9203_006533 [Teloschistes exilis]
MDQILRRSRYWEPAIDFDDYDGIYRWYHGGCHNDLITHATEDGLMVWLGPLSQEPTRWSIDRVNGLMGNKVVHYKRLALIIKMDIEHGDSPLGQIKEMMQEFHEDIVKIKEIEGSYEKIDIPLDALSLMASFLIPDLLNQLLLKGSQLWEASTMEKTEVQGNTLVVEWQSNDGWVYVDEADSKPQDGGPTVRAFPLRELDEPDRHKDRSDGLRDIDLR